MLKFFHLTARQSPSALLRSTHPYFCPPPENGDAADSVLAGLDPELSPIQIVALCADYRAVNEAEWDEVVWLWARRPHAWLWKAFVRHTVSGAFVLTVASLLLIFVNRPALLVAFWFLLLLLALVLAMQESAYRRWHSDYCAAVRRAL